MARMVARKVAVGAYDILVDGVAEASLVDCEVCWIFIDFADERVEALVQDRVSGDMSVREKLAVFRKAWEEVSADDAAEAKFELDCERALYRKLEYDAEAQIDEEERGL